MCGVEPPQSFLKALPLSTTETNNETATPTVNPCQRELSIEIPADVVATQQQKVIANYQKYARVPGFRKGKVPATVIKKRFDEDIKKDLIEALLPKAFREETLKQNLTPITQPQVTNLQIEDGQPLKFTAQFEVLPEFDVMGYQEIKAEREQTSVSDEEVEQALKNLQEQHSTYVVVDEDRPVQDGDYAQVSFKSHGVDGDQQEGAPIEMDDVLVAIGAENTIKEFSDNLRGAKAGEDRSFEVKYADDFADQRLAGKTLQYDVHLKGIKQKQAPELNDDFAKQAGEEFATIDDLRKRIRESMEHEKQHQAEHKAKDAIVEQLVAKYDIAVPQALVEHQIDQRLERGLRALAAQGLRQEQLRQMDMGRLREGQREEAAKEVKASLLLEKIADKENIAVSDEDVDKEVQMIARQMQQAPEAVRTQLEKNGTIERIKDRMRHDKALELLYKQ